MSAIRGKDTKPEMIVRRGLWKRGFRYRLNHKRLPGHPDLVLRKYRTCIFVNGCFWHGHQIQFIIHNSQCIVESSECCKIPKTNREFWVNKIRRNQQRDIEDQQRLAAMGWHCITVWECDLKAKKREETLDSLAYTLNHIYLQDHQIQSGHSCQRIFGHSSPPIWKYLEGNRSATSPRTFSRKVKVSSLPGHRTSGETPQWVQTS